LELDRLRQEAGEGRSHSQQKLDLGRLRDTLLSQRNVVPSRDATYREQIKTVMVGNQPLRTTINSQLKPRKEILDVVKG
jgi:hypothetical protein